MDSVFTKQWGRGVFCLYLILLLPRCMQKRTRDIDVVFDKNPWMEVTITAWKIDPKYKDEIEVFILNRCKKGDIPNPEFGNLLEKKSINRFSNFNNFDGFSQGVVNYGTWVIVMMSDTRGKSRVELITIDSSTPERITLNFTRDVSGGGPRGGTNVD
jgi:hypothetical protein